MNREMMSKIHRENMAEIDSRINGCEAELVRLQETRREYINRNDLNKDGTLKPEVKDEAAGTV